MKIAIILTQLATTIIIIGFIYGFLRNFKLHIIAQIDRLERRIDNFDSRVDKFDARMERFEKRMFLMATGKKLEDTILEERVRHPRTNP